MRATFHSKQYELVRHLVLGMQEKGKTYTWQEFHLRAADGADRVLVYDTGRWQLMEAFVPEPPLSWQQVAGLTPGCFARLDGARGATVTAVAAAEVRAVEGARMAGDTVGKQYNFLEAKYRGRLYTVEWTGDDIVFYRGRPLATPQVYMAFGLRHELTALAEAETRRRSWNLLAIACLFMALASLCVWLGAGSGGTLVSREVVPIKQVAQDGKRFGPFTLSPARHVHRLGIFADLTQASAWVSAVLEAEDGTQLLAVQRDFWEERGRDADGSWRESDLSTWRCFVVTRPGNFYIRLYVEPDAALDRYYAYTAGYELRSGVLYPTYLLVFGLTMLGLCSVVFYLSNPAVRQALNG
jgi:hypothetical protein